MADFLYNASLVIAAVAGVAIAWQAFTSDGSPSPREPDLFDPDDDTAGNDCADDADDD